MIFGIDDDVDGIDDVLSSMTRPELPLISVSAEPIAPSLFFLVFASSALASVASNDHFPFTRAKFTSSRAPIAANSSTNRSNSSRSLDVARLPPSVVAHKRINAALTRPTSSVVGSSRARARTASRAPRDDRAMREGCVDFAHRGVIAPRVAIVVARERVQWIK